MENVTVITSHKGSFKIGKKFRIHEKSSWKSEFKRYSQGTQVV